MTAREALAAGRSITGGLPAPWRYFARKHDGARDRLRWGWCWRERDLAILVDDLREYDVWVQFNESMGNEARPTREHITGWRGFIIDIDPVDPYPQIWYAKSDVVLALQAALLGRPSYTEVYTGRGLQLWIPSPTVKPFTLQLDRAVHELLSHLDAIVGNGKNGCRIDVSVADCTRLARMPYSVNQRTGARGYVERVGSVHDPINAQLASLLLTRWHHEPQPPSPPPPQAGRPFGAVLHRLTNEAADFLTEGASQGDRHRAACAAVYALREQGCTEREVVRALYTGAGLCEPPLEESEIQRILRSTQARRKPNGDRNAE